jgi:hypothetical protein
MNDEVILVVAVDVEAKAEEGFNLWYNDQHIGDVLDCPGWLWGTRYKSTEGSPNYLAIYGMASEEAMWTPERQSIKTFGRFWSHVESYWGRIYRSIHYDRQGTPFMAEGGPVETPESPISGSNELGDRAPMTEDMISVVGVDVEPKAEEEFNHWYDEKHVREVLDCPGWMWGTRYKSTEGSPNYLAIYGMECEEAMWTPQLQSIKGFAHLWCHIDGYWGRTYRRIYHESR